MDEVKDDERLSVEDAKKYLDDQVVRTINR